MLQSCEKCLEIAHPSIVLYGGSASFLSHLGREHYAGLDNACYHIFSPSLAAGLWALTCDANITCWKLLNNTVASPLLLLTMTMLRMFGESELIWKATLWDGAVETWTSYLDVLMEAIWNTVTFNMIGKVILNMGVWVSWHHYTHTVTKMLIQYSYVIMNINKRSSLFCMLALH